MMASPLGRFRAVALVEGISYLLLLFIAMPMKYWAGIPQPVTVVGAVHGLLFSLYILTLLHVWISLKWPILKVMTAFIISLIPFANFVLEARLRKEM
ncbi:DUF3817 domain-containing protein [Paenibacillus turpanensis]|uniref:DUF3817 domain-containing protein n=1 Tax=Paenibacillus turpanensis TaxID=2689078 RepID=UPI001408424B|nr:DUF3817 domain-containing protein [Paenibacillus turpanensis]